MGVKGGLCPLRIVRPSGAIKIIYIKFILSQPLRRTVVGQGLVSLSPPFLYVVKVDPSRNKCFSNVNIKHSSILDEKDSRETWILKRLSRRFLAIVGAADPLPHGFPSRCPCRQRRHHYIQETVIKEKREMTAYKLLLILQNIACHFVK